MLEPIKLGCVVYSKQGRDKGKYFAVVKVEEDFVYIADGELRPLKKAKKKNIKHIKATGAVLECIAEKLLLNKKIYDAELRSALREFNDREGIDGEK